MVSMYKEKCPYCGKEFEGYTEKQLLYYLSNHKLNYHPDRVKLVEKKDED
jgi:hypothetical protein